MRFRRPTWSFWLLAFLLLPLAAAAPARALPYDQTALAFEALASEAEDGPAVAHKVRPAPVVRPAARQNVNAQERAGPDPETPKAALRPVATVPGIWRAAPCHELQSWRSGFLKLRALGPRAPPSLS